MADSNDPAMSFSRGFRHLGEYIFVGTLALIVLLSMWPLPLLFLAAVLVLRAFKTCWTHRSTDAFRSMMTVTLVYVLALFAGWVLMYTPLRLPYTALLFWATAIYACAIELFAASAGDRRHRPQNNPSIRRYLK